MKSDVFNQSSVLILKCAYMHYIKDYSLGDIAASLGVSISTVSRLLKRAKEEKYIEFVIRDRHLDCITASVKLKERFALKDVLVVPTPDKALAEMAPENYAETARKLVAMEGARYLQRIIRPDDILGITWGRTVHDLVYYLNPCRKVEADFVTLHGSLACCEHELDVMTLVRKIAMAFGGRKHYLLAEAQMSNSFLVESIKKEKSIEKIFSMFDKVTIAVNSVAVLYPQTTSILANPSYLSTEELKELKRRNVRAAITVRFIDDQGQECRTDLKKRTLAIDLADFKKIRTKITVAAGEGKREAVLAALKGGFVDVLIIDNELAGALTQTLPDASNAAARQGTQSNQPTGGVKNVFGSRTGTTARSC